jgi:hypothetical protein
MAAGHIHDDSCYLAQEPVLVCEENDLDDSTEEVHVSRARCLAVADLTTTEQDGGTHVHTDDCYLTQEPVLVCDLEEDDVEEETVHVSTRSYTTYVASSDINCGLNEVILHTHDDTCYTDGELSCGMVETIAHQHTDDCFLSSEELVTALPDEVCVPDVDITNVKDKAAQTILEAVSAHETATKTEAAEKILAAATAESADVTDAAVTATEDVESSAVATEAVYAAADAVADEAVPTSDESATEDDLSSQVQTVLEKTMTVSGHVAVYCARLTR